MGAKWFCNKCGKEIWESLNETDKRIHTVEEMERKCICSDCVLQDIEEEMSNGGD